MKMSNQKQFEDMIKASLLDKAEKISPSDTMFENIKEKIKLNRSEKKFMLKEKFSPLNLNIKKSILAASLCTFIAAGSVFTFSPSARVSALQAIDKHVNGYISMKDFSKTPSKDELKKELGYEAKLPASLDGDYKLINSDVSGHIDGSNPDKQYDKKQAGGMYVKNDDKKNFITLDISKSGDEETPTIFKNAKTITIGNTTGYWTEYKLHIVPMGIFEKMSQQQKDKIDEDCKNGKEILVTVSNKKDGTKSNEEFKTTHTLKWTDNNINYQLTDQNNKLTLEEMSKIAQGIINSK